MPSVSVNLDVTIDASGSLSVFGQAAPTMSNVLRATVALPASDLYRGQDNSLVKFHGYSSGGVDDISGVRDLSFNFVEDMEGDLKTVLSGIFDASGATPFSAYGSDYHSVPNFGYVALGSYAHSLFGHVQATAAIDNDLAFVAKMIGDGVGDAALNKALAAAIYGLSEAKCTAIAKQVIGQDASRARAEDNDLNSPNYYQALEFKTGDVVYMSITLQRPGVSVSGAVGAQKSAPAASLFTPLTYVLKVTLS